MTTAPIERTTDPAPTADEARAYMRSSMLAMVAAGFDDGVLIESKIDTEGPGSEVLVITMKFRHGDAKS